MIAYPYTDQCRDAKHRPSTKQNNKCLTCAAVADQPLCAGSTSKFFQKVDGCPLGILRRDIPNCRHRSTRTVPGLRSQYTFCPVVPREQPKPPRKQEEALVEKFLEGERLLGGWADEWVEYVEKMEAWGDQAQDIVLHDQHNLPPDVYADGYLEKFLSNRPARPKAVR